MEQTPSKAIFNKNIPVGPEVVYPSFIDHVYLHYTALAYYALSLHPSRASTWEYMQVLPSASKHTHVPLPLILQALRHHPSIHPIEESMMAYVVTLQISGTGSRSNRKPFFQIVKRKILHHT
jgi:hypothetical protein